MASCCVCGQTTDGMQVKSTCSDNVLFYCNTCLHHGLESYEELVNYGFLFEHFSPSMRTKVIIPTLKFFNKTIEQFNEEILQRLD